MSAYTLEIYIYDIMHYYCNTKIHERLKENDELLRLVMYLFVMYFQGDTCGCIYCVCLCVYCIVRDNNNKKKSKK